MLLMFLSSAEVVGQVAYYLSRHTTGTHQDQSQLQLSTKPSVDLKVNQRGLHQLTPFTLLDHPKFLSLHEKRVSRNFLPPLFWSTYRACQHSLIAEGSLLDRINTKKILPCLTTQSFNTFAQFKFNFSHLNMQTTHPTFAPSVIDSSGSFAS